VLLQDTLRCCFCGGDILSIRTSRNSLIESNSQKCSYPSQLGMRPQQWRDRMPCPRRDPHATQQTNAREESYSRKAREHKPYKTPKLWKNRLQKNQMDGARIGCTFFVPPCPWADQVGEPKLTFFPFLSPGWFFFGGTFFSSPSTPAQVSPTYLPAHLPTHRFTFSSIYLPSHVPTH
jgi:hypothetical protein